MRKEVMSVLVEEENLTLEQRIEKNRIHRLEEEKRILTLKANKAARLVKEFYERNPEFKK